MKTFTMMLAISFISKDVSIYFFAFFVNFFSIFPHCLQIAHNITFALKKIGWFNLQKIQKKKIEIKEQ
jgi:hypothetical protein